MASDTAGLAERFVGRRLVLRSRWQRCFTHQVDAALVAALVAELQALVARLGSPFNRALKALELARLLPPDQALAEYTRHHDSPVVLARPGSQLHAAAMAADAAGRAGLRGAARHWVLRASVLAERCGPFDLSAHELAEVLGRAATPGNPLTAIDQCLDAARSAGDLPNKLRPQDIECPEGSLVSHQSESLHPLE